MAHQPSDLTSSCGFRRSRSSLGRPRRRRKLPAHSGAFRGGDGMMRVRDVVLGRCAMCHAQEPGWPETGIVCRRRAWLVGTGGLMRKSPGMPTRFYLQAGSAPNAFPPPMFSFMEDDGTGNLESVELVAKASDCRPKLALQTREKLPHSRGQLIRRLAEKLGIELPETHTPPRLQKILPTMVGRTG